jgi:hypothetical protein
VSEKDSKRLVIDADVARSAGSETAIHQRAINCREFLKSVREQNHRVVLTKILSEEWRKHQSRFSRRWRLSMDARKKVVRINPSEDEQFRDKITTTADNEDEIEVMQKDFHLLQAALDTDKTVISLDQIARQLFATASQRVGEIRNIIWVNPDRTTEEEPIVWLKNGAPPELHRQLSTFTPY